MNNVTISLCTDTHPVAQKMGNFSGWVRSKLKAYNSGSDDPVISETPSNRLLAVVLARYQAKHGFGSEGDDAMRTNHALCELVVQFGREQDA